MANDRDAVASRQIRRLFEGGVTGNLTDAELLGRFLVRDGHAAEFAFAALVERHGPMVLRVARSILRESHDADDAFQATFLILARKSGSLRVVDSIAPWLHGVTCRVAACIRSTELRRRMKERRAGEGALTWTIDRAGDDLGSVLHEEINRLPVRYRAPVVLCLLQGLTQEQAGRDLDWPSGTVRSRLARGRRLLQGRLLRRGLAPSAALLGASLVPEAVAAPLIESATRAGLDYHLTGSLSARVASASVIELTSKVLRSLTMSRFKFAALLSLSVGVGAAGFQAFAQQKPDDFPAVAKAEAPKEKPAPEGRQQAQDDLAKLQGVWFRVASEFNGRQASEGGVGWTATYEGDQVTLRTGEEHYRRGIVTLDPTTSPKSMNTWDRDGPTKDKTLAGIYELDGDMLRVCFAFPGKERPTEFITTPDSGFLCYTYKRQRP